LLRKRLEGDAGIAYLRSLISDFALNNKHRVRVTMSPSESFLDAQTQAEKALLERRLNAMSEGWFILMS
jgi:Zn-dependent M16 (insulinase) family peptidase